MTQIIFTLMMFIPSVLLAEGMDLKRMRMSLSGTSVAQVVVDKNRNTRVDVEIAPEFGIFVWDGLETFVRARVSGPLFVDAVSAYQPKHIAFGASLGVRYFYDTGTMFYPFAGMSLGVDAVSDFSNRFWTFELPVGVMIALSNSFGVTL